MKFKIESISADASFRKFYRFFFNKNSRILVLAEKEKYKNLIAYSSVNKFLYFSFTAKTKILLFLLKKNL